LSDEHRFSLLILEGKTTLPIFCSITKRGVSHRSPPLFLTARDAREYATLPREYW
jgi:hypothetical protein